MTEPEFESILEAYPVRLENFEGALDAASLLKARHDLGIDPGKPNPYVD